MRYTEGAYAPHIVDGEVHGFFAVVSDTTARVLAAAATRAAVEPLLLKRERDRIAADLHDKVIQRLYATGMQLAHAAPNLEPEGRAQVDAAIQGIDDTIVELRAAIHKLTHGLDAAQVTAVVAEIAARASAALGFTPRVSVSGDRMDLTPEVSGAVLAVLTESLSNVAKHAEASCVDVTILVEDGWIHLEIADDGLGIARLNRSSGLSNLRARAEQLGGTFTWRTNEPHGTVIEWRAPLVPRQRSAQG